MDLESYPNIITCDPSECISNKIMKCHRIIANIFRKHLSTHQITDSQLSILFYIMKKRSVNQKMIADFVISEKSTISRNLRRLISNQYISKDKGASFSLTDKGRSLLEEVIPSWENAMKEVRTLLKQDGEASLNQFYQKITTSKIS